MNYNPSATTSSFCEERFDGCTDSVAANYRPLVNYDDGSCRIGGCLTPDTPNYHPRASFADGSCEPVPCYIQCSASYVTVPFTRCEALCAAANGIVHAGCTNTVADNYRSSASVDDGSCQLPGCTDPTSLKYSAAATFDDGSCLSRRRMLVDGRWTDIAEGGGGGSQGAAGVGDEGGVADDVEEDGPSKRRSLQVGAAMRGCMSQTALNFNSKAQIHTPGACTHPISGCMDRDDVQYMSDATDNTKCATLGCMDPTALNFDSAATSSSLGMCKYQILGCKNVHAVRLFKHLRPTCPLRRSPSCSPFSQSG